MTTLKPPVPVHAVGDDQTRRQPLAARIRSAGGSRALATLAGTGVGTLLLTVDVLPLAVATTLAALALPLVVHLARTVEWH